MFMQDWITAHNRHLDPDPHGWHVYSKTRTKTFPVAGDRVLFYEVEPPFEGREGFGEKALVCASTIIGRGFEALEKPIGSYKYVIRCAKPPQRGRSVPFAEVQQIIPWYWHPAGFRRLKEGEYAKLAGAMKIKL